ncbi:MAG: hypothetical protein R2773_07480 [Flavobacteriaceae bacterium]
MRNCGYKALKHTIVLGVGKPFKMNNRKNSIKLVATVFVAMLFVGVCFGQETKFSFDDPFGNTIAISDYELISNKIDKQFLIENINGSLFISNSEDKGLLFDIFISGFEKINRRNYKFTVFLSPRTEDAETILKYYGGGSIYKLKFKKSKNSTEFIGIDYMSSFI